MSATEREPPQANVGGQRRPVLVAYATRFGSTQGVAERISQTLEARGHRVELRACDVVNDAGAYSAVVVGSAVFNQRWLPQADQFIWRNIAALSTRPVWLFTVGSFSDRKPLIGRLTKREPRNIGQFTKAIKPREYRVFAGVIDRGQWPLLSRLFYAFLGGHAGDNRDWESIEEWAESIARTLDVESQTLST